MTERKNSENLREQIKLFWSGGTFSGEAEAIEAILVKAAERRSPEK